MRIINFGSLNIDKVYQVEQFVRPGQTITAKDYAVAAGGKGLNQSLAAARAGAEVLHAGRDRRGRPLYGRSAAGIRCGYLAAARGGRAVPDMPLSR